MIAIIGRKLKTLNKDISRRLRDISGPWFGARLTILKVVNIITLTLSVV
jgi:hypothetical protein